MLSLFLANLVLSVLHFLVLSLRPMLAASSINLSVLHKSLNLDESSVMSSAKSRSSNTVVKFHCIPLLLSAVVFLMIQFMASNNKNPEITHPCFTPDLILNQSDICICRLLLSPSRQEFHSSPGCSTSYLLTIERASCQPLSLFPIRKLTFGDWFKMFKLT